MRKYNPERQGESRRRSLHSFSPEDELRYKAARICDWCQQPFNGSKIFIDHDHRCCATMKHCYKCTRGFVHPQCNQLAIAYCEWAEIVFGIVDPHLKQYRLLFPVPRPDRPKQTTVRRMPDAKTHCKRGHEFTPRSVYTWKNRRCCRICRNQWRVSARLAGRQGI